MVAPTPQDPFRQFLETTNELLTDEMNPVVRSFVRAQQARYLRVESEQDASLSVEHLVADLVSALGALEVRMNHLEARVTEQT